MSGIPYLPPLEDLAIFDPIVFETNGILTYEKAKKLFLTYPTAQGAENLQAISVSGLAIFTAGLELVGLGTGITFPDGTIQTTAYQGGQGGISVGLYTTTQTITPPTGTYKMDITIYSSGGLAGANYLNGGVIPPELSYGGSGAAGNMAVGTDINWNDTVTLDLVIQPPAQIGTTNYISVQFGTLGTAIVYNGNNGGDGLPDQSGGGAGGTANPTPNSLPTTIGNWTSYYGTDGQAGGPVSVTVPYPTPTAVGGSITGTVQVPGTRGGGQSYAELADNWDASPYSGGAVYITWYYAN